MRGVEGWGRPLRRLERRRALDFLYTGNRRLACWILSPDTSGGTTVFLEVLAAASPGAAVRSPFNGLCRRLQQFMLVHVTSLR